MQQSNPKRKEGENMKQLKNCIKLSSRITIYVPATSNVNKQVDNSEQVDKTASFLASCFGGATSSPAVGYWLSPAHGLVRENTTIVFAYADQSALEKNVNSIVEYCEQLKQDMQQESIALEINGEMYFI
jgi:hypothetical protein